MSKMNESSFPKEILDFQATKVMVSCTEIHTPNYHLASTARLYPPESSSKGTAFPPWAIITQG